MLTPEKNIMLAKAQKTVQLLDKKHFVVEDKLEGNPTAIYFFIFCSCVALSLDQRQFCTRVHFANGTYAFMLIYWIKDSWKEGTKKRKGTKKERTREKRGRKKKGRGAEGWIAMVKLVGDLGILKDNANMISLCKLIF